MGNRATAFAAFSDWVQELKNRDIPIVLLRPKAMQAESAFDGDFDYIADPEAFARIVAAAFDVVVRHGLAVTVSQNAPYKRVIRFLAGPPDHGAIIVEVWPHADVMLPNGRRGAVPWTELADLWHGLGTLPDTVLGLIYATHLHSKNKDLQAREVKDRLAALRDSLDGAGDHEALRIVERLQGDGASAAEASSAALVRLGQLGIRAYQLPRFPVRRLQRVTRRLARSRGAGGDIVPVLGPDGSGKTTLIKHVLTTLSGTSHPPVHTNFKRVFRCSLFIPAMYRVLARCRWVLRRPAVPMNVSDERHPHMILLVALTRWPLARRRLVHGEDPSGRSKLVLMDRYFWDYLLPVREERDDHAPIRAADVWLRAIPTPERLVILAASPETIRQRKAELSESAIIAYYQHACRSIATSRVGQVLIVPSAIRVEDSSAELLRFLDVEGQI